MFPNKEEDFTVSFFQDSLSGFPKIKSFKIKMLGTQGIMSTTRKVVLEYEDEEEVKDFPKSMILKFGGSEMLERMKALLHGGVIYRSEYLFYYFFHKKHPELKERFCRIPKIYHMSFREETGEFVFLMEDLSILQSEKEGKDEEVVVTPQFNQWKKYSLDEIRQVIEEAAKIHRLFWHKNVGESRKFFPFLKNENDDPKLKELDLPWLVESFAYIFHTQLFAELKPDGNDNNNWGRYNEENVDRLCDNIMKLFETWKPTLEEHCLGDCAEGMKERYKKVMSDLDWKKIYLESFRKMTLEDDLTMIHGDFRSDNIISMKEAGKTVLGIFDWQGVANGNGMLDIACIMMSSLSWEEVRDHEEDLLRLYHQKLDLEGVAFEKIKEMYRHALPYEMMKAIYWTAGAHKFKGNSAYGKAYLGCIRLTENCLVSVMKNIL